MPVQSLASIPSSESIAYLRESIATSRERVESHRLYREIQSIAQLRIFMESHVFAVWDFMSLLKSLQIRLTGVAIPWVPSIHLKSRRLINEIVMGEESDAFGTGYVSHFELYLQAMGEVGADTTAIRRLVAEIQQGRSLEEALSAAKPPVEAAEFVQATFAFIDSDRTHVLASAFTFGREDLVPDMFHQMVKSLRKDFDGLGLFEYYLDRHIDMDGDSHGPLALQMVEELCGTDESKWNQAGSGAAAALDARYALWGGILSRIRESES